MKMYCSAAVVSVVLVFAVSVGAQTDAGCVTSKCHADMGTKEFVHGPVGARICTVCHTRVEGEDHKFEYYLEKEELCLTCHEDKRDMMLQEHLHSPVADGNCVGCHDPHQSDYRYTLKGPAAELCFQCHDKDTFMDKYVHGPVGAGDCNICHDPHASPNEKQLVDPPDQICFRCHAEKIEELQQRHVHPPVAEKCVNCHDPHAGKEKFMLGLTEPDLCFGCHGEMGLEDVPHPPVAQGKCSTCHDVHASEHPRMFVKPAEELCFSCHSEMGEYISSQQYLHGPVKQGDCNACHNPHGSENARILRKAFPESFYMPYKTENYAMCFECHNQTVALDSTTESLTDFRDGDRNLHFLHVNKDPKGRSCKACHQAHATDQEKHIRRSVPYGSMDWELPINYTKLDDGGRCEVGCHAIKEYHRK